MLHYVPGTSDLLAALSGAVLMGSGRRDFSHPPQPQVRALPMANTLLEQMARAACEKHPLRNVAIRDNVIDAPPIEWEALDDFEKAMLFDAQRAALQAMIDAFQTESGGQAS
jgi:hypothetical protein